MSHEKNIDQFVGKVKSRLNRFRFFDTMIWTCLVVAAVLTILCLYYVVQGYAVPKIWYAIAIGAALVGGLFSWIFRLNSKSHAARYADVHFGMKDSVGTALAFKEEDRHGDFIDLQKKTTLQKIEDTDPRSIKYRFPTKILATALGLVVLCTLMAFKDASPEVTERLKIETETQKKTEDIKEYLEELVDELEKSTTDEEKEIIDPDKVKEWVEELKETRDLKDAMRQYAQLERKLQDAARRLDQRRNEQLLAKAGQELQKDAENRALGKKMEDKKFKEAAKELAKMKPEPLTNQNMSEQRKQLAKLRAASKRMAAAAKAANRKSNSSQQQGNKNQQSQNKENSESSKQQSSQSKNNEKMAQSQNSKSQQQKNQEQGQNQEQSQQQQAQQKNQQQQKQNLNQEIANLEKSLSKLEKAMQEAELSEKQMGKCDPSKMGECQDCQNAVKSDLDKLSDSMKKVSNMSESAKKLMAMSKQVGQCQGACQKPGMSLAQCMGQGQGQKPGMGMGKGGKQAGQGSVESRRNEIDPLIDNGQYSQIKGQKGQGPSIATIESAEDGTGTSSRRANGDRKIDYSKQIESFVQREDVPDDVKEGVKTYFESIHQSGSN